MSEAAVVVGGGPAGAMAALHLARAGRSPLLIERDPSPVHRICGEFLSFEAQDALREAGVEPLALGAATIRTMRLVRRDSVAETPLPFTALGLSRKAMDMHLLARAEVAGARVRRGVTARRIDGLTVETGDGAIAADALVLASGKHDLRGFPRDTAGTMADLVGFKMHYRLAPAQTAALAGHIEVILFDGGYAGLQLVEDGIANLCLLVSRARFARAGKRWDDLLGSLAGETAHLAARLSGAVALFERPLTVAGVPYGFRYRPAPGDRPRLYRAGDQLAVIPSFSGDGMAIALHSGRAAAQALVGGVDARLWHAERRRLVHRQLLVADSLHRIGRVGALQPLIIAAARLWPAVLRRLAIATRLSVEARS